MNDRCSLRQVSRPSINEVHAALQAWGGVVVHFSGVPAGKSTGLDLEFPADLRHVLNGQAQGGIACSTVRPGDIFEGPIRHSWGCLGVIVRGRTAWSLACVDPHDCGSSMQHDGLRICEQGNKDLSIEEVISSLDSRPPNDCNEWVVRDYDVLGVLVQPPFSVRSWGQYATMEEIVAAFGDQSWYSLQKGGLFEVSRDFRVGRRVPIAEFYPCSSE